MKSISQISSKLPEHKTSIFSVMAKMAHEHQAVNLSQGHPDFSTDQRLKDLVTQAMNQGHNQYAPLAGIPPLREEVTRKIEMLYGTKYDWKKEITITNGATQALFLAITAFVYPGDEVIVLKPAYDSYEPAIELNGGKPVLIQMKGPDYQVDWEEVASKINSKTKMLIVNNPHNPSGNVFSNDDLLELESILKNTDVLLLSDEVYEHIVFDDLKHQSISSSPDLSKRAIVCASFGKTFHNTGWKMGYCVAPEDLMKEMQKVMEVNVFCVHHPTQVAFAEYIRNPEHYLGLKKFYQEKRDKFLSLVKGTGFKAAPAQGTYFQLVDYSEVSKVPDVEYAKHLVENHGLAAIPVSVFNKEGFDYRQLRFCFAKTDETLEKAGEILRGLGQ